MRKEIDMNSDREYTNPVSEDGELFTCDEWVDALDDGWLDTSDGCGYWVKNGKESRDEVFSTQRLDATHVIWYNK